MVWGWAELKQTSPHQSLQNLKGEVVRAGLAGGLPLEMQSWNRLARMPFPFPVYFSIVWFQKISIPPPRRVFSSLTPHLTGFSVPEGFALLPLPPGISMIFFTWTLVPFGNSESKKKDLIYFDLLRAVIKIKFS